MQWEGMEYDTRSFCRWECGLETLVDLLVGSAGACSRIGELSGVGTKTCVGAAGTETVVSSGKSDMVIGITILSNCAEEESVTDVVSFFLYFFLDCCDDWKFLDCFVEFPLYLQYKQADYQTIELKNQFFYDFHLEWQARKHHRLRE